MALYKKIFWSEHAKIKIRQYGLSRMRLVQIINRPERKEQGIAPKTVAVMQTKKVFTSARALALRKTKPAPPGEIWLMYQDAKGIRTVISAWRYPGISKPGQAIPLPADINQELYGSKNISS